ncbi:MAG: hypothetical protein K0R14_1396 [Burkholderiales bacterium]|jgi:hypothetical protein|nr:hypothetical protein [Burkholderiales bacterium]
MKISKMNLYGISLLASLTLCMGTADAVKVECNINKEVKEPINIVWSLEHDNLNFTFKRGGIVTIHLENIKLEKGKDIMRNKRSHEVLSGRSYSFIRGDGPGSVKADPDTTEKNFDKLMSGGEVLRIITYRNKSDMWELAAVFYVNPNDEKDSWDIQNYYYSSPEAKLNEFIEEFSFAGSSYYVNGPQHRLEKVSCKYI